MKTLTFLVLLGICLYGVEPVIHTLKYFYTGSTQIPRFPEFVTVGMVDDQQIDHYDSITGRAQAKQDWMPEFIANEDPHCLERNTQIYLSTSQIFKVSIENVKQRFNQTEGVHTVQNMYGCEWDDETKEVKVFAQYGVDGEDFIAFNVKDETWIAPKPQAVITKNSWDKDKASNARIKNYLTQECLGWLKKYLKYGESSLMKTVLPSVSLLQKSSSSPVRCYATGFYPNRADLVWKKDGVELHEGVDKGEILMNHDGTFQMSVDLKLSSVKAEDWDRYACVFQLSGVNSDIVIKLEKSVIKTNEGASFSMIISIVLAVVLLAVIAVIAVVIYKKKMDKRPPSPVENREVQAQMLPK